MDSEKRNNIRTQLVEMGGKLPPQNTDMEEAILGSMMLEMDSCDMVFNILSPNCFYKDSNQRIFEAISELYNDKKPVDILTVTNRLRSRGDLDTIGGPYYIAQLTNRIAGTANVEEHARIVYQCFMKREFISIGNNMVKDGYDETEDVFDIHSKAQASIDNLINFNTSSTPIGISDLDNQFVEKNNKLLVSKGLSGVTSGLTEIDKISGGWQKTDLIILAARPGMGKTSLALKYLISALKAGYSVIFFSLEMSREQLYARLISMETGIPLDKITKTGLNPYEMEQYIAFKKTAESWKVIIDDTPALSVQDMRLKTKQYRSKLGAIDLIITDYLQLHTFKGFIGGNRNEEVGKISGGLKSIAKEFNTPVIALSQLSRSVETRGGSKEPMLSDLRESGSIEQDADIVNFLYRPEYYNITEDEKGQSLLGVAKVIFAKHRNGSLDDAKVSFSGKTVTFSNLAYFTVPPPPTDADDRGPNPGGITPNFEFDTNVPDIPF